MRGQDWYARLARTQVLMVTNVSLTDNKLKLMLWRSLISRRCCRKLSDQLNSLGTIIEAPKRLFRVGIESETMTFMHVG
jgi:hypothetical protein